MMNEADVSTVSLSSKRMTLCVNLTLINWFEAILFAGQSVRVKKTTQLLAQKLVLTVLKKESARIICYFHGVL